MLDIVALSEAWQTSGHLRVAEAILQGCRRLRWLWRLLVQLLGRSLLPEGEVQSKGMAHCW